MRSSRGAERLDAGGRLELMLCCDLVVAARSAKLGDAHANYGLLPGGGSSVRLPQDRPDAGEVSALYRRVRAGRTVCRRRLVNQVVDDDALIPATEALVASSQTEPAGATPHEGPGRRWPRAAAAVACGRNCSQARSTPTATI